MIRKELFEIETALLTRRMVLRRFREEDGQDFHHLVQENHSLLQSMMPELLEANRTPLDSDLFIRKKLADWLLQRAFHLAIWEAENPRMIGLLSLTHYRPQIPAGQVEGFIDKKLQQQGYMTEAMTVFLPFCFEQLKLEKLRLLCLMDNYAAQRVARKFDFHREGDLRAEHRAPSGELSDLMLLGLTRVEYEKI